MEVLIADSPSEANRQAKWPPPWPSGPYSAPAIHSAPAQPARCLSPALPPAAITTDVHRQTRRTAHRRTALRNLQIAPSREIRSQIHLTRLLPPRSPRPSPPPPAPPQPLPYPLS